jgi:hypothetical protein
VLTAGLTLGRQTLIWWGQTPPVTLSGSSGNAVAGFDWAVDGEPITLEFGDHPGALARQRVQGDFAMALNAAFNGCRPLLDSETPPPQPMEATERQMLQAVATMTPTVEQPGVWQIYELPGGLRTLVGVRNFPQNLAVGGEKPNPQESRRVVCWGLMFPQSPESWTIYTFRAGPGAADSGDRLSQIELPPDSRRGLALREAAGGGLLSFQGPGHSEDWIKHFTAGFAARGWSPQTEWRQSGATWNARFAPGSDSTRGWVDVQFGDDGRGELSGLVNLVPEPATAESGPPAGEARGTQ